MNTPLRPATRAAIDLAATALERCDTATARARAVDLNAHRTLSSVVFATQDVVRWVMAGGSDDERARWWVALGALAAAGVALEADGHR